MRALAIIMRILPWTLLVLLAFASIPAIAAVDNAGVLNKVLDKFNAASNTWHTVMIARATWLFWILASISMVWTFGMMLLRKADIGEFYAEFIRFTMFTGFFWWLLLSGPQFAGDILNSLRKIGAEASGLPNDLGPSGIVDVGFDIFFKVVDQSALWKPIDSLFGMLLSVCILIVFALVGTNMLLLLVSGYLFAYAGVFVLGFGGSKWTSEMAIGYYKSILNIALQLMTMVLIVGIGRSFVDQYYSAMSSGMTLKELGVMAVVAVVLLFLVAKVPQQIGSLAGGTTGNLGTNFGVAAAVGAATFGAAAVASTGAAMVAGAAGVAGGAQALMAAFSKASGAENAGTGASALMDAAAGSGAAEDRLGADGGSALATAMGDSRAGAFGPGSNIGKSDSSENSAGAAGGHSDAVADAGASGSGKEHAAQPTTSRKVGSPDGLEPPRSLESARATAAKIGKVAAGTVMNLAQGAWDVGTAMASDIKDSASERIGKTTGGKIAAAIMARDAAGNSGEKTAHFDEDSISSGGESVDAEAEIAAFRDRDSKGS